jgi:hypothetical protein
MQLFAEVLCNVREKFFLEESFGKLREFEF